MRERLNVKATAVVLVATAALAAGFVGLHRWQVRRQAEGLLGLAQTAEDQGKLDRAVGLFTSYLAMRPADAAARARYALLLNRAVRDDKSRLVVADLLEQVLAADPGRADARRELAGLYTRLGLYAEALPHLTALGAATSPDAELAFQLGLCHDGRGDKAAAEAQYRRSLALDPKPVPRSLRLAALIREGKGPGAEARAGEVIDRMVAANPDAAAAHLARVRYRLQYGGDPAADLAAAVKLAPADVEVRLVAAAVAPAAARGHLQEALTHHPRHPLVHLALADVDLREGKPAAALGLLRRGLAANPGDEGLLFGLAELQLRTDDLAGVQQTLAEIDRWKRSPVRATLVRGRLQMANSQWKAARDLLEAGRPALTLASPALAAEADLLIARCCEQTGEDDLALAAYRRAGAVRASAAATTGAARVLVRQGRTAEAVGQYRQLTADPACPPDTWLMYARLKTVEYLESPAAGRTPADLEPVYAEAERRAPGAAELVQLRAEVLAADGKPAEAAKRLQDALDRDPRNVGLGLVLARLLVQQKEPDKAWAVLDKMAPVAAADPDWHLTRLELAPAGDDPHAAAARAAAEQRLAADLPADERARLAAGLATASARWQDWPAARRWWTEVGRLRPADLSSRFQLFTLAVRADDRGQMEAAVRALQQAEGAAGPFGQYAAALLNLVRPQDRTPDRLREARQQLAAAALSRPNWAIVPATQAALADVEGKPDEALTGYLRAVELGDRRPEVVRRAVQLLSLRRRFADAEALVRRVGGSGPAAGPLGRLVAELALVNADTQRAAELAGAAIAPNSQDYSDHLWQAEVLAAAGKTDDATAAVRRAVAVSGSAGPPRLALVRQLVRAGKRADAEAEVADLGRHLTGKELALTAAQCLEAVGKAADAAAAYKAALAAHPDDPEVVRQVVAYYDRAGTPAAAAPAVRRLLAAKPSAADATWARRTLALALAADGGYPAFVEALGLFDPAATDPTELTVKAQVLATRLSHRRAALAELDRLRKQGPLPADADFVLGQLQADVGDWREGRRRLVDVLTRDSSNKTRVAFLIDRLVQHGELNDAEFWLERLGPDGGPVAVRLQALVLAKRGRAAEAADLLRRHASVGGAPLGRVREAAGLAVEVGRAAAPAAPLEAAADELFAQAAASGEWIDQLALAVQHGRRGRADQALELCRQARAKADPAAVANTLAILAYTHPPLTPPQLDAVERELATDFGRVEPPAARESLVGAMHARRGRYAEAAEAFGRAGGDPEAVNNRAYMLVLAGRPADEALRLLAPAFDQAGPTAALLDTRGVALLAAGRTAEAVADLEQAVEQQPTAGRCLHLTQAYQQAGRKDDAERTRERVRQLLPDGTISLPAEQKLFDEVVGTKR